MAVNPVWRIRLLSVAILLIFVLLVARLFFLQVVKNNYYLDKADRQYQRPSGQLLDRGTIFSHQRDGALVSAATMQDGFILALNPSLLKEPEIAFQKLSALVSLDRDDFFKKASKITDPHEELINRLNPEIAEKVKALDLAGVLVYKNRWRFYPAGRSGAHVIGLLNREGVGTYGLEKYYNDFLQRQSDESFIGFLSGILSDFGGSALGDNDKSQSEGDLVLNLEPVVQSTLEAGLVNISSRWQPERVGGIIMDPSTGQIIAMAALPSFDPGGKQDS